MAMWQSQQVLVHLLQILLFETIDGMHSHKTTQKRANKKRIYKSISTEKEEGVIGDSLRLYYKSIIRIGNNRTMEESKISMSDSLQMSAELKNIQKIEKSIADMQAHINFLLKREVEEDKKIQKLYHISVKAAQSKITHANLYQQNLQKKKKKMEAETAKNNQVRQIRSKEISLMKQTRMQVSRLLDVQKQELKEISNRNKMKIRQIKEKQLQKNVDTIRSIKQAHADKIKAAQEEKDQQKKRKQEEVLQQNLLRLSKKEEFQTQMQSLKKQKQEINKRLKQKQQQKQKLEEATKLIKSLDHSQILQKAKVYKIKKSKQTLEDQINIQNLQDLEKSLFKTAVDRTRVAPMEPVMFFR